MFTQLVYTSKARGEVSKFDLYNILKTAVAENPRHRVTGFLLYKDGKFRQAIEGPDNDIQQLYDNICNDPRHEVLGKDLQIQIAERTFPMWAMAFSTSDTGLKPLEKDLSVLPPDVFDNLSDSQPAVKLLIDFLHE